MFSNLISLLFHRCSKTEDRRTGKRKFGDRGEQIAADFLKSNGYKIVGRNVMCGGGEIDIIASDQTRGANGELVFVEVKTRSSKVFGGGRAAMNPAKKCSVCRAASAYMRAFRLRCPYRFDLVEVICPQEKENPEITHYRNAFPMNTSKPKSKWFKF